MIDILIPTYNRLEFLKKNLLLLDTQITKEGLSGCFRIIVSNNYSSDNTAFEIPKVAEIIKTQLLFFNQTENIGLERNAIFLLSKSTSKFIIYLGDDDYLPDGYLSFVYKKVNTDASLGAIIPGFSALSATGETSQVRHARFSSKLYPPGFISTCRISHFGHQLSGLVLCREHLLDRYTQSNSLRNIYPFIFFLSYSVLRGNAHYCPKYQVLVSQDNNKDWRYDDSGLLTEILKNFRILYPNSAPKRLLLSVSFILKQPWRLGGWNSPMKLTKSVPDITSSTSIDFSFKICVLFIALYLATLEQAIILGNKLRS